jgi:hypothetical protein
MIITNLLTSDDPVWNMSAIVYLRQRITGLVESGVQNPRGYDVILCGCLWSSSVRMNELTTSWLQCHWRNNQAHKSPLGERNAVL